MPASSVFPKKVFLFGATILPRAFTLTPNLISVVAQSQRQENGANGRNRTVNVLFGKQVLYRLSYERRNGAEGRDRTRDIPFTKGALCR